MDFTELKDYIDNIDKSMVPSSRVIVKKGNETLFEYFSAREDIFENEKEKELYYLFSLSKVITCTGAMMLVEKGLINLEDPVYKYLPEFKDLYVGGDYKRCHQSVDETMPKAKNTMLIKHLFTMGGGYGYDLGHPEILKIKKETNNQASTREIARAISKMPLLMEPGQSFRYGLCHDVLAAVCEVVTGKTFFEYLDEEIFTPLNMKNTLFQPRENELKRMHNQYTKNVETGVLTKNEVPICIFALSQKHQSGGAGIVSSLKDYSTFASCLATGVSENGYSLLKKETMELMRTPMLTPEGQDYFTQMHKPGYSYGLGVWTHLDSQFSKSASPKKEFGWDGAAGSYVMIDPDNQLSIVYMQHVLNGGKDVKNIHLEIKNLVYTIINE